MPLNQNPHQIVTRASAIECMRAGFLCPKCYHCLWLVDVTLIFDGTPQIIVQRCQTAAPRCPAGSEAAALWLIMRSSKTEQKTSSVTSAVWHIVPSCWHQTITIAIDCSGLSLHIFEEKWPNYVSGPKYAPNSDSFWVRRLLYICVRVCLFTYPSRLKWASSEKMIFFFAKIGIFCKMICRNISQLCSNAYTTIFVPRKDKTNYLSNQIWAKCYHSRNTH